MDLASLQRVVRDNPKGVLIRMVDGKTYRVPHRDDITIGPPPAERSARGPHVTSFLVWDGEAHALVNALLVAEVTPLKPNGNGNGHGRKPGRRTK